MGPDLASILMKELLIKIFVEEQKVPHYQLTCQILGPAASLVLDVTEWQMVNGHMYSN